jgi:hypothetical protein
MKRRYALRVQCGHPGCAEFRHIECVTRADYNEMDKRYSGGKWRCTRHMDLGQVLSIESPKRMVEMTSTRAISEHTGSSIGLFWNRQGFVSGPGFKAWANDFPEGTILRVTAEVILP